MHSYVTPCNPSESPDLLLLTNVECTPLKYATNDYFQTSFIDHSLVFVEATKLLQLDNFAALVL